MYWRLVEEDRHNFTLWRKVQMGLIKHFGSDPTIHDLPRLMRLPGTINSKVDQEHELWKISTREWSLEELVAEYDLELPSDLPEAGKGISMDGECVPSVRAKLIEDLDATCPYEGMRYAAARKWVAQALGARMEASEVEILAKEALMRWGYSDEQSTRQAANTLKGTVDKLMSGELTVSEELRPDEVFADDEKWDVKLPTLLEICREAGSPSVLIKHKERITGLTDWDATQLVMDLDEAKLLGKDFSRSRVEKLLVAARKAEVRQSDDDERETVDPVVAEGFRRDWKNTYCIQKGTNYSYWIKRDGMMRGVGKDSEMEMHIKYLTTNMKRGESSLFRAEYYRDIHTSRRINETRAVSVPFGESEIRMEEIGSGLYDIVSIVSIAEQLQIMRDRLRCKDVPQEFVDWMDANYGLVFEVHQALLARRFLGDKESVIFLHLPSNWGKSFFFGLQEYAIFVDNSYDSDTFRGNDPADFAKLIYMWADEATKFTKEMKSDQLGYRKLYGGNAVVTLPGKLIAAANEIADLSDAVDAQIINRVMKIEVKHSKDLRVSLEERGWNNNTARRWFMSILSERYCLWLASWIGQDAPGAQYYRAFVDKWKMKDAPNVIDVIRESFWHHFLWEHVEVGASGYRKRLRGWAWGDDKYLFMRGNYLYIKRVQMFADKLIEENFSKSKDYSCKKSVGTTNDFISCVGGESVNCLPGGQRWNGFRVNLEKATDLNKIDGGDDLKDI